MTNNQFYTQKKDTKVKDLIRCKMSKNGENWQSQYPKVFGETVNWLILLDQESKVFSQIPKKTNTYSVNIIIFS